MLSMRSWVVTLQKQEPYKGAKHDFSMFFSVLILTMGILHHI